jgi:hypothetical protein
MTLSHRVGHFDTRLSSKGCLSCIRMKVKVVFFDLNEKTDSSADMLNLQCDQTKPHCRRCLSARRQCPGYRSPATLFVIETGSGRTYTSTTLPPSAPLATDWLQHAINHYVHNFVIRPDCGLPGLYDDVPQLYTSFPNTMYLQRAVQAVALTHLAHVNQMGSAHLLRAQRLHGDAIQCLRVALNDDAEARSATALMTAELLWQYDVRGSKQKVVLD